VRLGFDVVPAKWSPLNCYGTLWSGILWLNPSDTKTPLTDILPRAMLPIPRHGGTMNNPFAGLDKMMNSDPEYQALVKRQAELDQEEEENDNGEDR
jgi:hypothetical protein